jgi:Family of unknown function (DUF6356)
MRHFTDHPASVGESYLEHMQKALCFGFRLLAAGGACLVHAFLPFLCVKTGSRAIAELNERMVLNRRAHASPPAAARSHFPT